MTAARHRLGRALRKRWTRRPDGEDRSQSNCSTRRASGFPSVRSRVRGLGSKADHPHRRRFGRDVGELVSGAVLVARRIAASSARASHSPVRATSARPPTRCSSSARRPEGRDRLLGARPSVRSSCPAARSAAPRHDAVPYATRIWPRYGPSRRRSAVAAAASSNAVASSTRSCNADGRPQFRGTVAKSVDWNSSRTTRASSRRPSPRCA